MTLTEAALLKRDKAWLTFMQRTHPDLDLELVPREEAGADSIVRIREPSDERDS